MFNKKTEPEKNQKKRKKGVLEKVVMGVIVGGAIGSVVGLAVAPKKGSETREYLKEKGKEVYDRGKEASENTVKNGTKVWRYIKKKLLKRK